jgi:hypothetical protein
MVENDSTLDDGVVVEKMVRLSEGQYCSCAPMRLSPPRRMLVMSR